MISLVAPVEHQTKALFSSERHPHRVIERLLGNVYRKAIERFALTKPPQGWVFCVLEK
jgi:hypothetical protein